MTSAPAMRAASLGGGSGLDAGMALAQRLFDDLAALTADPPGVTRVAYGPGEQAAFALMADAAVAHGAAVAFDPAGNQFLTLAGNDSNHAIQIGSHLDSVPHGGNFDGAAGVIMGLALQAALVHEGRRPPFDVVVACLRAEESCWFPYSYVGSKTALGRLDPSVLEEVRRSDTGRSLAWHMADLGFDPAAVARGEVLRPAKAVAVHVEPHIEQGPVLVAEGVPVGIVTGIRGSFRYRSIRCDGAYAHSGATPRSLRSDAVLASAELVVAMQGVWETLELAGHDLAITFGEFGTDPASHSFSKVAGETHLCLDVRSQSPETLVMVEEQLKSLAWEIGQRRGVVFHLGPRSESRPASMSTALVGLLEQSARAAGVAARIMASGAGHDAAVYAQAGVPTAMLFIRNENGSHNPAEHMAIDDFRAALAVLFGLMETAPDAMLRLRSAES